MRSWITSAVTFKVVVDSDDLEVAFHGSLRGRIFALVGDDSFPDPAWWDFPCVVLGWWVQSLRGLGEACELRFMDCPAVLEVVVGQNDVVKLAAKFETGAGVRLNWTADVSLAELRSEGFRAAEDLVRVCVARDLPTDGLEHLLSG